MGEFFSLGFSIDWWDVEKLLYLEIIFKNFKTSLQSLIFFLNCYNFFKGNSALKNRKFSITEDSSTNQNWPKNPPQTLKKKKKNIIKIK
jgi:hypothetical protein